MEYSAGLTSKLFWLRMSALLDDKEEMNEQKDRKTDKKKE